MKKQDPIRQHPGVLIFPLYVGKIRIHFKSGIQYTDKPGIWDSKIGVFP